MKRIRFDRPKYGQDIRNQKDTDDAPMVFPSLETTELDQLKEISPRSAVFSSLQVKVVPSLPLTPHESLRDLHGMDVNILETLGSSLTQESIERLEKVTRRQSASIIWKKHRVGRITGSKMHSLYTLRPQTSRGNVINDILGLKPEIKTKSVWNEK